MRGTGKGDTRLETFGSGVLPSVTWNRLEKLRRYSACRIWLINACRYLGTCDTESNSVIEPGEKSISFERLVESRRFAYCVYI
jgi:hypothetical protein